MTLAEGEPAHVKVTLAEAQKATLANPQAGGMVMTESGVAIDLPAGSLVDAQGNPVTEPVEITISLLNDRDEILAAPGGLIAANPEAATTGEAETPLDHVCPSARGSSARAHHVKRCVARSCSARPGAPSLASRRGGCRRWINSESAAGEPP